MVTDRSMAVVSRAHARHDVVSNAIVGAASDVAYVDWEWWRYLVGAGAAYHGYMRSKSVLWAVGWYFAGFAFPLITIPVAVAQYMLSKKGK